MASHFRGNGDFISLAKTLLSSNSNITPPVGLNRVASYAGSQQLNGYVQRVRILPGDIELQLLTNGALNFV